MQLHRIQKFNYQKERDQILENRPTFNVWYRVYLSHVRWSTVVK